MTALEALAAKRLTEGKKKPRGKRNHKKNGRTTLFKKSMIKQTRDLILMGYTHEKIAEFYGLGMTTIYKWKSIHEGFRNALNTSKDEYDSQVVRSLFDLATGYNYTEKKTETEKNPLIGPPKVKIIKTKKHMAPNVGAIKVWLYNRRSKEFKPEPALASREDIDQAPPPPLIINYNVNPPIRCVKITTGKDG